MSQFRAEKDSLGFVNVPVNALYGAQTARARDNFQISGTTIFPEFIHSSAQVKRAAALANMTAAILDKRRGGAIVKAATEIEKGDWDDQFVVDVFQAGAGTSHNMNTNEVIAHRANKILGDHSVHPNDHVNMSQSTNDYYPTVMRICAYQRMQFLIKELQAAEQSFRRKAQLWRVIRKSGRTHLQDAVPMTLGQEFQSYASSLKHHQSDLIKAAAELTEVGFGGTAVGSGLNAPKKYRNAVIKTLRHITGVPVHQSSDLFYAMWGMAPFTHLSGALRNLSVDLIKIANDLRLLSSGPRTGLNELNMPAVQPGSSIMPGKINPVICECLNMICFQVIGNDTAISLAAQAGQLQLNVMMPVINYNLLHSIRIMTNGLLMFRKKCVDGITMNKDQMTFYADATVGLATVLNTVIGYDKAAEIAKESVKSGKTIKAIVLEQKLMTEEQWNRVVH